MKLGDLFTTILAAKLGLQNDPQLISLLSNAELAQAEVDDQLAQKINTGLMSFDGAKNNIELQKHFKAETLNGVDAQMARLAEAYGFADANAAEHNTFKKFDLLAAKLEEAAKKGGSESEQVKNLTKQIADLQYAMRQATESKDAELAKLAEAHRAEILNMLVSNVLTGKDYANKQLDKEVNVLTARTLLDRKLAEAKAVVVNEGGKLSLKQAENPSLDYVNEGFNPVSFGDFVDRTLADAKLLKVTPAAPQNLGAIPSPTAQQNGKVSASIAASIADLGAN